MATWACRFKEWYAVRHPAVKVLLVVTAGAGAVAGATLVAAPALGAALSAAGLGVAGGTLSGAAASSAGLAALGGGSMASGGLGVAVVTNVIGGVSGGVVAATAGYGSHKVSKAGAASGAAHEEASRTHVDNDGFRWEEV